MEQWEDREIRSLVRRIEQGEKRMAELLAVRQWAKEVYSLLLYRADGDFALMRMMRNAPEEIRNA